MNRPVLSRRPAWWWMAPLLLLLLAGCGTVTAVQQGTRKVAGALTFSDSHPRRVALMGVENRTFLGDGTVRDQFRSPFLEGLNGFCPALSLILPAEEGAPAELATPPRQLSGRIDNLALARTGRQYGVHAAIFLRDLSITAEEQPEGILMFRDTAYYIRAEVRLEVYSMATGAKLVDANLRRREEVGWEEYDAARAKAPERVSELPEMMTALSRQAAERACDAIRDEPWRAFVVAVEDGRGVLSSGREANLEPGETLALFSSGEVIEGQDGQRFRIPGIRVGEVRVAESYVGRAIVEPLGGETIEVGSAVGKD